MTPRGEMPFLDHLEELRWRILWSLVAIVVGTVLGWVLLDKIDIIDILKRPIAPYLPGGRLVFTSPAEPFMLTLKVAFALGCVVASPVVIYQIWAFLASLGIVTPQFLGRQRRYAIVIAAFLAALLTPPDAVSMMLMLGPLLLLYELSIWCAWVASRRRARRIAAATMVVLVLGLGGASLHAQNPPPPPPRRDTAAVVKPPGTQADSGRRGIDTATARKSGLPTGPTRSFPPPDAVMDSLLKLQGFQITHYMSDTFVVLGDSQMIFLRREAYVERDGTQLQADSIRYHEASCRLNASGDPQLFDQCTVLIGEGMPYDTPLRRGTLRDALTDFRQGGGR